jgi:phosphotransferase system HPr (HPr) family protein
MQQEDITINNAVGLHARPASIFVQTSNKFTSDIYVEYDEKTANAKSILQVLSLGVKQGGRISLKIDGDDEIQALTTLKKLIAEDFGE